MVESSPNEIKSTITPIEGVHELQGIYAQFSKGLNAEQTPQSLMEMLKGETQELHEAILMGDSDAVGAELADVILFAVEIANRYSIDLPQTLGAKMTRNYHKYNPVEMQQLMDGGLTRDEARSKLKSVWDRNRDKMYK
jgi:NTP pyrophosphatase (non-canonical NTP hydrolase)